MPVLPTVGQLSNYGAYFPYDLMHICAHGGETDGYFVVQKFTDREGADHTLEYYEVVGFAPSGRDMVRVHRKLIFKRLDGFPWMSKPLKGFPRYVFEDMTKAMKENDDEVIRTRFDSKIALSCHIQCSDSIHPEVKRNSIPVARFLLEAIVSNFSQERVEQLVNFDPTAIEEEERIASALPTDDFSRGIREMDIIQERQRR